MNGPCPCVHRHRGPYYRPPGDPGLCQCGCGKRAPRSKQKDSARGLKKGDPLRFIPGHHRRNLRGPEAPGWKGGRVDEGKRILLHRPDHPNADAKGYVAEHTVLAAAALGRPVPRGAHVHHVNEDPTDNRPSNLVICQDNAYHKLIHYRTRALREGGNANWRRCRICKKWDDPDTGDMWLARRSLAAHHRACHARYQRFLKRRAQGEAPLVQEAA